MANSIERKFCLGQILITPGAIQALQDAGQTPREFLLRHVSGDWGDICPEDKELNDAAIAEEGNPDAQSRVLSAYTTKRGEQIWIISEWDRSATTILLPEEY